MSKRSSGEEWSDDDTDGFSLNDSPPKRQKGCQQFERQESSESGFISRSVQTIKRFTSSVNNLFKGFSLSSEERHTTCDSVSNQSSVGMSQTDNSYSLNVSTGQQLIQSPMILTPLNSHSSNYVLAVQQSTHETNPYITQSYIPIQIQISTNTSPNHLMVVSNSPSTMLSNGVTKCTHCGQISSSPKTSCGHCRLKPTLPKDNKLNTSSHAISTQRFYTSSGIQTLSGMGIGRGRHRSESPKIQLFENRELNRPRISDVRSLNNNRYVFQPLHQLIPNSAKKANHELIELDAESTQRTSQDTNDECIEIMDSNNTEEVIPAVGVQCDFKNDSKSDVSDDIKPKTDEQNPSNHTKESEIIVENLNTVTFPDYAMFGTYKTEPKTIDFTKDGIKLTNVSPNNKETKFKYHIMIPFIEMEELLYCTDGTTNLLIIKPLLMSNLKIQKSMYLGEESPNGLKFDINSSDIREHYLIIVLREKMGDTFLKNLTQCSKDANESVKVNRIGIDFGKHLLQRSKSQREISTTVQIINNSNMKTPPNRNHSNPFSTDSNQKSRVYQSSDSSDSSPTPSKYLPKARRSIIRTPVPQIIETIIVDDDDEDGEEIITANNHLETEFDRVIFSYPLDDKNAIHLVGTDIKCLNKGEFLNDNIVNFFLSYFFNEKLDEEMRRRTHIFDTLFFMQLTEKRPTKRKSSIDREESYSFETRYNQKLKKWTKDVKLFSKDFLIFPIIKESHWFLAIVCYPVAVYFLQSKNDKDKDNLPIIDFEEGVTPKINDFVKRPCIIFMDSLGNASYKKSMSTPIREFLNLEWKDKYDCELMFKGAKYIRDYAPHVPNQTNSSDCGLFVLEYVEQFLKCPDDLVKRLIDNRKNALIDWFDNHSVKTKRQEIRSLILNKVSPELRERLETLIDDNKLSDNEDFDEIGMEVMNHKSHEQSLSKDSSPEQEVL